MGCDRMSPSAGRGTEPAGSGTTHDNEAPPAAHASGQERLIGPAAYRGLLGAVAGKTAFPPAAFRHCGNTMFWGSVASFPCGSAGDRRHRQEHRRCRRGHFERAVSRATGGSVHDLVRYGPEGHARGPGDPAQMRDTPAPDRPVRGFAEARASRRGGPRAYSRKAGGGQGWRVILARHVADLTRFLSARLGRFRTSFPYQLQPSSAQRLLSSRACYLPGPARGLGGHEG